MTRQAIGKAADAYGALEGRFRRYGILREVSGMLHWDSATVMPSGGAETRADQQALLEVMSHEMLTDPAMEALLEAAEDDGAALDPWPRANLREMRRAWRHANALPADLVEAFSRAGLACEMRWREARPAADFALVQAQLTTLLGLVREMAAAKADAFGLSAYDALMDSYEPGVTADQLDGLFDELAAFLPPFLNAVLERQAGSLPLPLEGPFPLAEQERLGRRLMGLLGFDFDFGRLDTSLHPFCGGVPEDVRITTRYDEDDFLSSLMGVLHETGHALYERNLPAAWRRQPVGYARGMGIHESQSLLIEMQACRSPEVVGLLAGLAREAFGGSGPAWAAENLRRHLQRVEPGPIRVEADEVTYPLHVILRYRLERRLIGGSLEVADIPEAWNAEFEVLLGFRPADDAAGCLQDIHWYDGAWGYFPSYTLGALAAAQLFAAARAARPEIPEALKKGDFTPLNAWLAAEVHALGSFYESDELIAAATGHPLGAEAFKEHLQARYLP